MKIGLISLGCPKNLVDSEVMLGFAQQAGHEITHEASDADVLVVNTCAFIDKAKKESIDTILEMAEHKKSGRCKRLIVTGCMAERYRDELRAEIPEIDVVLGTGEVPDIVGALSSHVVPLLRSDGQPITQLKQHRGTSLLPTYIYDADTPRLLATPSHYAYIKIAEGCDYKCSFCIIPTLRGAYRSRAATSIIREAESLSNQGIKELLLISQDTTYYGIDRNEKGALASLLRRLNSIEGLEWIRLLYLYPTTINEKILEAIGTNQKVCRYIDLPLQHASDAVLRRMKRPGNRALYSRLLKQIRTRLPGVALRTTFIVGFPGETDADINELISFVREIEFDHVGVFTYSHEENTTAYNLQNSVPEEIKTERRNKLMHLQQDIVQRRLKSRVGEQVQLIIDGTEKDQHLVVKARLQSQAPEIDSAVYLTDCDPSKFKAGDFIQAKIIGTKGYDLLASPTTAF